MNIKEIIVNEGRGGSTDANQSSSFMQDAGDFVSSVGTGVKDTVTGLGTLAKKGAEAAVDPQTYKDAGNAVASGAEFAVNNPGQAAYNTAKFADDAVRAGTNALTFGYADKVAGVGDAAIKGNDLKSAWKNAKDEWKTGKEWSNQQQMSADAEERSPVATKMGEIGSYFVPFSAFNAGMKGANLVTKGLSKTMPKATKAVNSTSVGRGTAKVVDTGAGLVGGIAGDKAAARAVGAMDPDNVYAKELRENSSSELNRIKNLLKYGN